MREETAKHKEIEIKRNREIAQLRKESRKHENVIRLEVVLIVLFNFCTFLICYKQLNLYKIYVHKVVSYSPFYYYKCFPNFEVS